MFLSGWQVCFCVCVYQYPKADISKSDVWNPLKSKGLGWKSPENDLCSLKDADLCSQAYSNYYNSRQAPMVVQGNSHEQSQDWPWKS